MNTFKLNSLKRLCISLCTFGLLSQLYTSCVYASEFSEHDRDLFRLAVQALEQGDYENFRLISARNKDYLLYPYLRFYDLKSRIGSITDDEVDDFVNSYSNMPLGARLKAAWIQELAKRKRWDDFIENYNNRGGRALQCQYLSVKYKRYKQNKQRRGIIRQAKKIWMSGKSQPKQCIPLFDILYKKKLITQRMLWQRITKAMKRGNVSLARSLSKRLPKRDRELVDAWRINGNNPQNLLKTKALKKDNSRNREIVLQIIQRYARQNAEKAKVLWSKLDNRYKFSREDLAKMQRYIALRASYQLHPDAYQWLSEVKPKWVDDDTRIWLARSALRTQNWKALEKSIKLLSNKDREDEHWRYWYARAIEKLGNKTQAELIYKEISTETSYYGFLASDRINADYTFGNEPLERDPRRLSLLETIPGIQRSRELFLVGRLADARREWNYAMRSFDEPKIKLAAVMAYNWEWYDNAIVTVARTGHRSDYKLRFPTPYKDKFQNYAETYGIDTSWVYGVARRESAFKVDARSRVGAMGLMQLMPATARLQSKMLGLKRPRTSDLIKADSNIQLGSAYLNQMLLRFEGSQALATAAYNAGPRRVEKWIPQTQPMSIDVWVDTVPYKETREYVRAVMAYATIFNWRLRETIMPLKERMGSVLRP